MELRGDNLLTLFNGRTALDMDGEDGMGARRIHIQVVVAGGALLLTFEQAVQCRLLVTALLHSKAAHGDLTLGVFLDRHSCARLVARVRV